MPDDEKSYYLARAEEELKAADAAGHPEAARAHALLAGYYLDLAFNPAARPGPAASPAPAGTALPQMTGEAAFA